MKTFLSLIKKQNSFSLKSQGQSMLPLLQENDIVYFKKTPFSKIKVNDLVIFKQKNQIICHRVIYISPSKKFLITKGDNSLKNDNKIYPHQILGKVYQVKRNNSFFNPETLYLIQSTHYFNEIVKIKNEFDKQKINYLFLKGLPLHLYFEGKHPSRIYADCDVLIDKKDFQKAQKILLNFSYKKTDLYWSKTVKKFINEEIEATFVKLIKNFTVIFDLHPKIGELTIVHLGNFSNLYQKSKNEQLTTYLLQNKIKIKVLDKIFYILNPPSLILYLSLHLFHHNFTGTFRYQFLDLVIRKNKNQLNKILEKIAYDIEKYKLNAFVYPTFYLLKKYYHPHPPFSQNFLLKIKPKNYFQQFYIKKFILKTNIFNDQLRIKAGVFRFLNLFILSPNPLWKKVFVFFNPQVILAILYVIFNKIIKKLTPNQNKYGSGLALK